MIDAHHLETQTMIRVIRRAQMTIRTTWKTQMSAKDDLSVQKALIDRKPEKAVENRQTDPGTSFAEEQKPEKRSNRAVRSRGSVK